MHPNQPKSKHWPGAKPQERHVVPSMNRYVVMYLRHRTDEIIKLNSPPHRLAGRSHGNRAWHPSRGHIVVTIAPLCVLIVVGILICLQLLDGLAFDEPVAQAQVLQNASIQLMLDEETGLRGFAAARQQIFLEPLLTAIPKLPSVYDALSSALVDLHMGDAVQHVHVLSALNERWLATVEQPLLRGRLLPAQADVLLRRGKTIVDAYRSQGRELAEAIGRRVVERRRTRRIAFAAFAAAVVFSLVLCVLGMWFVARELASGKRANVDLLALQHALLPPLLPRISGCHFDALYESGTSEAHIGGDWYDAVRLIDGRILISIGDVAGSGREAAVVMGVVRQIMRGIAQLHAHPARMLDAADRALRLEYPDVFVTAWVGVVDLVSRTVSYASAGHPPALLCTSTGMVTDLSDKALPLGLRQTYQSRATTIAMPDRSTLVLYTDGLTEATRDLIAGDALLHEAAAKVAARPGKFPAAALRRHVLGAAPSEDDLAILVAGFDFAEAEVGITRLTFDVRDAEAARHAREVLVTILKTRGFPPIEKLNAELVFSELIGNVLRHADTGAEVEVSIDCTGPQTILHVQDRGPGYGPCQPLTVRPTFGIGTRRVPRRSHDRRFHRERTSRWGEPRSSGSHRPASSIAASAGCAASRGDSRVRSRLTRDAPDVSGFIRGPEPRALAAARHEGSVCAGLGDPAVRHDDDAARVAHGGKPVRDKHDGGAP
jgi:CHASE3 domain sensor protein